MFEASPGHALTVIEAWGGALAYTLQLYFDFSGYSDMAIGLSKMFNVDLPLNFNSPYKATSIIDFWRRWHMTLSRFLRDYLYVRLGGNRKGPVRRYVNLLVTMLLGGLWHGAGWTFVVWGGVHGVLLVINHGWRNLRSRLARSRPLAVERGGPRGSRCSRPSRAWSWPGCSSARRALAGAHGRAARHVRRRTGSCCPRSGRAPSPTYLPIGVDHWRFGALEAFGGLRQCVWSAALLAIVFCVPNSQTLVGKIRGDAATRAANARASGPGAPRASPPRSCSSSPRSTTPAAFPSSSTSTSDGA